MEGLTHKRSNERHFLKEILPQESLHGHPVSQTVERYKSEKEKLISNRDQVRVKVEATNYKTRRVLNDVISKWLNDVEKLIEEMENEERKIKIEIETAPNPDWYNDKLFEKSYEQELIEENIEIDWETETLTPEYDYNEVIQMICERHSKMLKKIKMLNDECDFEPFSSPIPGLVYFSSGDFVCSKYTEKVSDRLLEALQDDSNLMIGLHGKQGSGKTTFVKAVAEKAKYLKIFNVVLFATLSSNPIKRIQDQIADSLNLKLDKGTEFERAREIRSTLSNTNRTLVILDDVRGDLEPDDIGIPCGGNKILLTTRLQCNLVRCQVKTPLFPIPQKEAWMLFKKHSGIDNETPYKISKLGQELAVECQGLPGRIKDVGTSLKSEPIEHWNALLESLRHSTARYHIYISFRGKDVNFKGKDIGYSFAGYLYQALCREGFKTFMDIERLEGGDEISPSLVETIEASRLSIVVFSQNYASSCLCLDELVAILKCKETNNQVVWPIFYKVEPTDIRHQKNNYAEAMAEHEKKFTNDPEKVQRWRSTLSKIVNMSGFSYTTGYEYKFIQDKVERANNIKKYDLYLQSWDMD